MSLAQLLAPLRLLEKQSQVLNQQADLIARLELDSARLKLEHAKEIQGLLSAWLVSIERPEIDLRADLATAERELCERIAVLEEYLL